MNRNEELDEILLHFGVKGMRWGVRKDRSKGGGRKASKEVSARRRERSLDDMETAAKRRLEDIASVKARTKAKPSSRRMKILDAHEAQAKAELKNIQDYRKKGGQPVLQKALKDAANSRSSDKKLRKQLQKKHLERWEKANESDSDKQMQEVRKKHLKDLKDAGLKPNVADRVMQTLVKRYDRKNNK